jgi:hypothetical protein
MHVLWRQGPFVIECAGPARLAYNSQHLAYIREYYLYCVDLFAQAFERYGRAVDVTFGNYGVNFGAKRPSLRIDIQHEHTLVKPGGRDSAGAPLGTVPLPDGSGNYLVRLTGYAYLKTLDTVIEYSRPNSSTCAIADSSTIISRAWRMSPHCSPMCSSRAAIATLSFSRSSTI